jgi:hypothetical protein
MRDKFATVGFQTKPVFLVSEPSAFLTTKVVVYEVIFSIADMKISATMEIPKNNQHKVNV